MKKLTVCVVMALVSLNVFAKSMTIDEAIGLTASELGQRLNKGGKIAVLNFSSDWEQLSTYVIDELNNAIVRDGSLTVVNRQQLDIVRKELNFQKSGEVSDQSAQNAGKFLGAQSVLSGSLTIIGKIYRFRIRVIAVETGVMEYSNSLDIKSDNILTVLTPKQVRTRRNVDMSGFAKFGRNIGYGLLNPIFGLGSYIQGDPLAGGLPLTLAYIPSGILVLVEFTAYDYWDDGAGVCGTIGLGIASAALLHGFIRPFVYSSRNNGMAQILDGLHLDIVPTADNGTDVSIKYSISF